MNAVAVLPNHGYILFSPMKKACLVSFHLSGFEPFSTHAIHIHEYGDLRDGCTSLGGHFNPDKKPHGNLLSKDRHAGDLINNFSTNEKGVFEFQYIDKSISVSEMIGRSIVIHRFMDDLGLKGMFNIPYHAMRDHTLWMLCKQRNYTNVRTKKERIAKLEAESLITGNAGSRIVCAVIGRCA